jgi:adenylate kinase
VIELKVDEGILLQRIERRVAEMTARGEKVRSDDNPEVLKGRLEAYRVLTAPLADYYAHKGMLKTVDGMAPVDEVTAAIDAILTPAAPAQKAVKAKPAKAKAPKAKAKAKTKPKPRAKAKPAKASRKTAGRESAGKAPVAKASTAKSSARRAAPVRGKKRKSGGAKNKSGQVKSRTRRRLTKAR